MAETPLSQDEKKMPDTRGVVHAGPWLEANLRENWREGSLPLEEGQEGRQRCDALYAFIDQIRRLAQDHIFFDGYDSGAPSAKVRCTQEDYARMQQYFDRLPERGCIEEDHSPQVPRFIFAQEKEQETE